MKKKMVSFAVLALFFAFCANSGECKTVNYYYNVQPYQMERNNSILYNKYNAPNYVVRNNRRYTKPYRISNNYRMPYYSNYTASNYPYYSYYAKKQPSIWQRIFNL